MMPRIELPGWLCTALALGACTVLAAAPAQAQGAGRAPEEGPRFVLRAYYLGDSFSHSETALGVDTFTTVSYRGRPGGGLDAEYLFSPWVGLDLAASQTHIEADEVTQTPVGPSFETKGNIQVRPYTLGLYGHFFRLQHMDAYIGPTVGLVQMSSSFRPSSSQFAFGATLGLDFPLGSSGLAISGYGSELSFRFPDQLHRTAPLRDDFLFGGGLAYRW
ncbi:MAG TPA: hypothetical protein VKY89_18860 [Thermoanaerobaculia bacterium]|jgi:outer membrane protein W|nr:hypothetical protein [Thermoanaerobaculia bacterium]